MKHYFCRVFPIFNVAEVVKTFGLCNGSPKILTTFATKCFTALPCGEVGREAAGWGEDYLTSYKVSAQVDESRVFVAAGSHHYDAQRQFTLVHFPPHNLK